MANSPLIDSPDYAQISKNFALELSSAAKGEKTSLPFIKNKLPKHSLLNPNQVFQVFVIGGTNGAMALGYTDTGKQFTITEQEVFKPLPTFATLEQFVSFIAEYLYMQTSAISINFAYITMIN